MYTFKPTSLSKHHDDALEEYITGERLTESFFLFSLVGKELNTDTLEIYGWFVFNKHFKVASHKYVNRFKAFMLKQVFGIDYERVSRKDD